MWGTPSSRNSAGCSLAVTNTADCPLSNGRWRSFWGPGSPQHWRACRCLAVPLLVPLLALEWAVWPSWLLTCEGRVPAFLGTRTPPFPGDKEPGVPGRPLGIVPGGCVLAASASRRLPGRPGEEHGLWGLSHGEPRLLQDFEVPLTPQHLPVVVFPIFKCLGSDRDVLMESAGELGPHSAGSVPGFLFLRTASHVVGCTHAHEPLHKQGALHSGTRSIDPRGEVACSRGVRKPQGTGTVRPTLLVCLHPPGTGHPQARQKWSSADATRAPSISASGPGAGRRAASRGGCFPCLLAAC